MKHTVALSKHCQKQCGIVLVLKDLDILMYICYLQLKEQFKKICDV